MKEKKAKEKSEERKSISVACPKPQCGAMGKVPIDRLDRQLTCKTCGTRFYLDRDGSRMMIGERPDKFDDAQVLPPPPKFRPNLIERLEIAWRNIPEAGKPIAQAIIGGGLAIALGVFVYSTYLKPGPKLPKSLMERARFVAKAFTSNKPDLVAAIADRESGGSASAWINKAHPSAWPKEIKVPRMSFRVMSQNPKKALVSVEIEPPGYSGPPPAPTPPPAPPPPPAAPDNEDGDAPAPQPAPTPVPEEPKPEPPKNLKLQLYWVNREGGWLLDLASTLAHVQEYEP